MKSRDGTYIGVIWKGSTNNIYYLFHSCSYPCSFKIFDVDITIHSFPKFVGNFYLLDHGDILESLRMKVFIEVVCNQKKN